MTPEDYNKEFKKMLMSLSPDQSPEALAELEAACDGLADGDKARYGEGYSTQHIGQLGN